MLVMVSKFGHCLYDLLHRWRSGQLPVDIAGVVSNHDDMRSFTEWNGLPYHHLPVARGDKEQQEARIIELIDALHVDVVVLARYMQILSPALCGVLSGRCINIHTASCLASKAPSHIIRRMHAASRSSAQPRIM